MTRFEDRLTDLLRDASDGVDVSPGLSRTVLADARRNQRKTLVLGAGAGLLGTGVVAAGAFALAAPTHQKLEVVRGASSGAALPRGGTTDGCTTDAVTAPGDPLAASALAAKGQLGTAIPAGTVPATALPGGGPASTTVTATTGNPRTDKASGYKPLASQPVKPAGLDAISLPNPAPGFPLRRGDSDTSFVQSGGDGTDGLEWTRFFAVETSPPRTEAMGCGGGSSTPTGPEATILVVPRFAGDTAGEKVEGWFPVESTTTARGTTAYVANDGKPNRDDSATILQVSTDKWTVIVTGDMGTTLPQMVALANAIDGI